MHLSCDPHRRAGSLRAPEDGDDGGQDAGAVPVPAWQAWLETAVLAGVAAVLQHTLLAGGGERLVHRAVPWLALAPLLAGLRYGSKHGVACGAAGVALLLASGAGGAAQGTVAEISLGWLLAGLVPGAFRDAWRRRVYAAEARRDELGLRLEGLARSYHALEASHDRLRLETGTRSTLRDALDAFRRELVESPASDALESAAARFLDLLREVASVHAATLYPVDGGGRPGPALAAIGCDGGASDDALVLEAARSGAVVSVRQLPVSPAVLAAVPLVDVTGRVHAVVAVHDMPFLALHADTLVLLAVLGGHAGDVLSRVRRASREDAEPAPLRRFCSILSRAMRDARELGVPASLALVDLQGPPSELPLRRVLARHVAATRRLTDDAEVLAGIDDGPRVLVLLRLADEAGLRSHRSRLERLARERARELGSHGEIRIRGWSLEDARLPTLPRELEAFLAEADRGLDGEGVERGVVA